MSVAICGSIDPAYRYAHAGYALSVVRRKETLALPLSQPPDVVCCLERVRLQVRGTRFGGGSIMKIPHRKLLHLAAAALLPRMARAQAWPLRPARLVVAGRSRPVPFAEPRIGPHG